jgi:lambda repressor-like predicted transcriptional regulator
VSAGQNATLLLATMGRGATPSESESFSEFSSKKLERTNDVGTHLATPSEAMVILRRFDPAMFVSALSRDGWTTERLAARVGISYPYLCHVRRGLVPSDRIRRRIALALGVDEGVLWPMLETPVGVTR